MAKGYNFIIVFELHLWQSESIQNEFDKIYMNHRHQHKGNHSWKEDNPKSSVKRGRYDKTENYRCQYFKTDPGFVLVDPSC